jgi:hypothetical protein
MNSHMLLCLGALTLSLTLLQGCASQQAPVTPTVPAQTAADDAEPPPNLCADPRPQVCTMEYLPVCAIQETGVKKTYASACNACADIAVVSYLPAACGDAS